MNNYYFGTMDEYVSTGYAPTGRAACKTCKKKIEKDTIRMGICMDNDHFNGKNWYHLDCFVLRPLFKEIDPEQQIYNIDQLEPEDHELVLQAIKNEIQRLKRGKSTKRNSSAKKRGRKSASKKDDSDQQYEQIEPPPAKGKAKSLAKPQSKGKRSTSAPKSEKKKAKKKKKAVALSGFTSAQETQFKELYDKYMKFSADRLKNVLATNNQSRTGAKGELAQKCADGELLGRIPMCSACGGGKLRFDRKTGIYKCPGYMDDDQFKNCNKSYAMFQVVREPWKQP